MNQLTLDLTDADIKKALASCESGESVELTVSGTLTKSGKTATVAVDEVKYSGSDDDEANEDPAEEAKESPAEEAAEEPMEKPTPKPKAKRNYPAALDEATIPQR